MPEAGSPQTISRSKMNLSMFSPPSRCSRKSERYVEKVPSRMAALQSVAFFLFDMNSFRSVHQKSTPESQMLLVLRLSFKTI